VYIRQSSVEMRDAFSDSILATVAGISLHIKLHINNSQGSILFLSPQC